jgi:hypothetical protein
MTATIKGFPRPIDIEELIEGDFFVAADGSNVCIGVATNEVDARHGRLSAVLWCNNAEADEYPALVYISALGHSVAKIEQELVISPRKDLSFKQTTSPASRPGILAIDNLGGAIVTVRDKQRRRFVSLTSGKIVAEPRMAFFQSQWELSWLDGLDEMPLLSFGSSIVE